MAQGRIERDGGDAEWRAAGRPPRPSGDDGSEERTMAMLAWALLLAGVLTFFVGIVAAIVAYAKRGAAPPLWRGHYDAVIRMFWIWLLLTIVGTPLILLLGLGYLVLAVAAVWTAAVGVRGLIRASENRPA